MPPLALDALFALYRSTQVCIRPLPADSVAYLGEIADGNMALPADIGAAAGAVVLGAAGGFAAVVFGAGVGAAAGAAAGVAVASDPHWAFRTSGNSVGKLQG
jgi:hypothetical protein